MVVRHDTNDAGFSLSELIIVLSLLGVILAAMYGGVTAVYHSREVSDRQALFAREVSTPLNAMEEAITQALSIDNAGAYSMTFLTDRNNDNTVERHTITCSSDGRVTHQTWLTDNDTRANTTLEFDTVWSEHNTNQADTQPMFRYFDEDGNVTSDRSEAVSVQVRLNVEYEDRSYTDSRTIFMRNR